MPQSFFPPPSPSLPFPSLPCPGLAPFSWGLREQALACMVALFDFLSVLPVTVIQEVFEGGGPV